MERIRQLRKQRGLSQARLAVMSDMDPATLNRLERGTGNPNLKTLERVAEALGVEVADFFPKAQRRSSLEPTLLNALEEERRVSRFSEAIIAVAARWGEAVADPDMNDTRRIGVIDAALELSDVIWERVEEEDWETIPNQERLEIVTIMEQLNEVAAKGVNHLESSVQTEAERQRFQEHREQIRQWTRQISA